MMWKVEIHELPAKKLNLKYICSSDFQDTGRAGLGVELSIFIGGGAKKEGRWEYIRFSVAVKSNTEL